MENWVITFLASFLIWILFLSLLTLPLFVSKVKFLDIIGAILAIVLSLCLSFLVKGFLPEVVRPFYENGFSPLTITIPFNGSFPSDHSAFVFALAMFLWLKDKRVGLIYFLAAVLVGGSRVVSNVHYPIDILGGAVLGIFSALLVDTLFKNLIDN